MPVREMLIAGASRGIGQAVAAHYESAGERVLSVSRTPSPHGTWIEADLARQDGIDTVIAGVGARPLDALLYTGGIWEHGAFTARYAFGTSTMEEIDRVIAVNLLAPIKLVRGLLPNLKQAQVPRILLIGSLDGLDNNAGRQVANSASKFGLRGAAQALQKELAGSGIGVTVVNPDNVATTEVLRDIEVGDFPPQTPIPMADLVAVIDCALSLSGASVASEINLAQIDGACSGP